MPLPIRGPSRNLGGPPDQRHLQRQAQPGQRGAAEPGSRRTGVQRHLQVRGEYRQEQRGARQRPHAPRALEQHEPGTHQLRGSAHGNHRHRPRLQHRWDDAAVRLWHHEVQDARAAQERAQAEGGQSRLIDSAPPLSAVQPRERRGWPALGAYSVPRMATWLPRKAMWRSPIRRAAPRGLRTACFIA